MNYDVTINGTFWKTLTYTDPQLVMDIVIDINNARTAGQLTSFEKPDGSWGLNIAPQA